MVARRPLDRRSRSGSRHPPTVTWDIRPIGILDLATRTTVAWPTRARGSGAAPDDADADAGRGERSASEWSPDGATLLAVPTGGQAAIRCSIDPAGGDLDVPDMISTSRGRRSPACGSERRPETTTLESE